MSREARYAIVIDSSPNPLVIRDVGPWDTHLSVTNDVERVVEELHAAGKLPAGRRLLYYDSMGELDEIVVEDGQFIRFAPGPGRAKEARR